VWDLHPILPVGEKGDDEQGDHSKDEDGVVVKGQRDIRPASACGIGVKARRVGEPSEDLESERALSGQAGLAGL
jgi:hypothetical protein